MTISQPPTVPTQTTGVTNHIIIDGAFDSHSSSAGAGWIIKTTDDSVLSQGSTSFFAASALQAEAMALLQALKCALSVNCKNVIILTDSQLLIQHLPRPALAPLECQLLLSYISDTLKVFDQCNLQKAARMEVAEAHILATTARTLLS